MHFRPSRSTTIIMALAAVGLVPSVITNPGLFGRFPILCFALLFVSYAPWFLWWHLVLARHSNVSVDSPTISQLIWSLRTPLAFFLISIFCEFFVIWQFFMSAMTIEVFPHHLAMLAAVCFYAPLITKKPERSFANFFLACCHQDPNFAATEWMSTFT